MENVKNAKLTFDEFFAEYQRDWNRMIQSRYWLRLAIDAMTHELQFDEVIPKWLQNVDEVILKWLQNATDEVYGDVIDWTKIPREDWLKTAQEWLGYFEEPKYDPDAEYQDYLEQTRLNEAYLKGEQ